MAKWNALKGECRLPYKLSAGFSQKEYFLGAEFPAEGTGIFLGLFGCFCAGNGNYAWLRYPPVEGDLCRLAPVFLSQLAPPLPGTAPV